jgi:hypothetical protein
VLDEYYEWRGWDKRTGLQKRSKLEELGLEDVAEVLAANKALIEDRPAGARAVSVGGQATSGEKRAK